MKLQLTTLLIAGLLFAPSSAAADEHLCEDPTTSWCQGPSEISVNELCYDDGAVIVYVDGYAEVIGPDGTAWYGAPGDPAAALIDIGRTYRVNGVPFVAGDLAAVCDHEESGLSEDERQTMIDDLHATTEEAEPLPVELDEQALVTPSAPVASVQQLPATGTRAQVLLMVGLVLLMVGSALIRRRF